MDALNEFIANDPTLRDVFRGVSSPSLRYWTIKKGVAHNRYERHYAYATQKARGPDHGPIGFYAMVYEVHPEDRTTRLVRSVHFKRRKSAKARAYRWYMTALGKPESERAWFEPKRLVAPTPEEFEAASEKYRAEHPDPAPTPTPTVSEIPTSGGSA